MDRDREPLLIPIPDYILDFLKSCHVDLQEPDVLTGEIILLPRSPAKKTKKHESNVHHMVAD